MPFIFRLSSTYLFQTLSSFLLYLIYFLGGIGKPLYDAKSLLVARAPISGFFNWDLNRPNLI